MDQENIFPNYTSDSHSMDEIPHNFLPSGGLTKRDLFSAFFLQAMLGDLAGWDGPKQEVAASAIEYADILIAELSNANTKN